MKIENISCTFLKADSFDFSGKTYYTARLLVNGDVYKASLPTELYGVVKDYVEKKGVASFALSSRDAKLKFTLASFK